MGDLISREELRKALWKMGRPIYPVIEDVDDLIVRMPAIDAEPVRRGTWKMCRSTLKTDFATITGTYPTCSLCGYVEYGVDKSTPYCPGCGAKMDRGDDI